MKYSNPVQYFTDGNNQALFTFKPRENPTLFYIQVRTERHIPISVIVPAKDLQDARHLLREAMKFKVKCGNEYLNNIDNGRIHATSYRQHEIKMINNAQLIIDSIDNKSKHYEIIIEKVSLDQFFKTGWAINDTI